MRDKKNLILPYRKRTNTTTAKKEYLYVTREETPLVFRRDATA